MALTAIVPDITGQIGVLATFDGTGSTGAVTYDWVMQAKPPGSDILLDRSLNQVLLYHCEETSGTVGVDSSPSANNCTLAAVTVAAVGTVGTYSWSFTSGSSTARVLAPASLAGGEWTASLWFFNLAPVTTWRTAFRGTTHQIILNSSGILGAYIGGFRQIDTAFAMSVAAYAGWHHIAVVGTGTDMLYYVDGVYVGTVVGYKSVDNIDYMGSFPGQRWADRIDEISVWNRALSAADVADLFNNPAAPVASTASTHSFTPDVGGIYTVKLTVGDGIGGFNSTTAIADIYHPIIPLLACGWEAANLDFYLAQGWYLGNGTMDSERCHQSKYNVGGQVSLRCPVGNLLYSPSLDTSARWLHFWMDIDAWPPTSPYFYSTFYYRGGAQFTVQITNTGTAVFRRGSVTGAVVATAAGTLAAGPHWVSLELKAATTAGSCNLYVDGALVLTYSGNTSALNLTGWGVVLWANPTGTNYLYLDDIFVTDASDGEQSEMYGYGAAVIGAGGSTGWVPSSGTNWHNVQHFSTTPVTYNVATSATLDDLYVVTVNRPLSAVGWVGVHAFLASPGSLGVQTLTRAGATTEASGTTLAGGAGSLSVVTGYHGASPNTGLGWTEMEIASLQIGLRTYTL